MRYVVVFLVIALLVLHHDFWWWYDVEPLVFGFVPIGLAYHACISAAAAIVWALAIKYCWPEGVDDVEEMLQTTPSGRRQP